MIEYKNKFFESKSELARELNIDRTTLTYRLKKGLPLEDEKGILLDLRKKKVLSGGSEYSSLEELCQYLKIDTSVVRCRLQRGIPLTEAIQKDKKITKQGIQVQYNGEIYTSLRSLAKSKNLGYEFLRKRINSGWSVKDAVDIPKGCRRC